ncbi:MAG: hypothetical protein V4820_11585 [Pseudomonadota bacterium]
MDRNRYSWRPGSRIRIDAQKAGAELSLIEKETKSSLTPEAVLDRARTSNSTLHDHFEWDDGIAAEKHRLGQAGELIRSIVVDVSRSNLSIKNVRAFVSVEQEGARSYISTARAMSDADLRRQVVRRAWEDFEALRKRHEGLSELASIFEAIDQARPF